jgi:hypothetical protein
VVTGENKLRRNAEVFDKSMKRSRDSDPRFEVGTFESFIYVLHGRFFGSTDLRCCVPKREVLCDRITKIMVDGVRDEDAKIMFGSETSCLIV